MASHDDQQLNPEHGNHENQPQNQPAAEHCEPVVSAPTKFEFSHETNPIYLSAASIAGVGYGPSDLQGCDANEEPTVRISPHFAAKNLLGSFRLKITAARKLDADGTHITRAINPTNSQHHKIHLNFAPDGLSDIQYQAAEKSTLPQEFQTAAGFNIEEFRSDELGFLSFTAHPDYVTVNGDDIPTLKNEKLQSRMEKISSDINSWLDNGESMKFVFIVRRRFANIWAKFIDKMVADKKDNPMKKWIKDSPHKLQLQVGNIFPSHERPALPKTGWIANAPHTYMSKIQMNVYLAYAAEDEMRLEKVKNELITEDLFHTTLTSVPKSDVASNPFDHNLPKAYYGAINWKGNSHDRPQIGQMISGTFHQFDLPDCTAYTGENAKPPYVPGGQQRAFNFDGSYRDTDNDNPDVPVESSQDNAEGNVIHDEGEVVQESSQDNPWDNVIHDEGEIVYGEDKEAVAEQEQEILDDKLFEEDVARLKTMTGIVVRPCHGFPAGYLQVVWFRPFDFRFQGPVGCERRVETSYPSYPLSFGSMKRFNEEIESATTHQVKLKLIHSTQMFKDVIRLSNQFFSLEGNSTANAHHSQYFLAFNRRIPFPIVNFFEEFAHKDWEKMTDRLSPRQKDSLVKSLNAIHHGYLPVHGVVASAKSYCSILIVLMALANKEKKSTALMIQETNVGVDDLALNTKSAVDHINKTHGLDINLLIIRVGSLGAERSKFTSQYLPKLVYDNISEFDNDGDIEFLSEHFLHKIGKQAEQVRKSGDRRFSSRCKDLYLHEAMRLRFESMKDTNEDYMTLEALVDNLISSPNDSSHSVSDITPLVKILMLDTLRSADVVVTTPAQALRFTMHTSIPNPTFLLLDEYAKGSPENMAALAGAYNYKVMIENGDCRQEGVYSAGHMTELFWCPFRDARVFSNLERGLECGQQNVLILDEQHRMYTPGLTKFISKFFYAGTLLDGTEKLPTPPQVKFIKAFFKDQYKVEDNLAIVNISKSKSETEAGGYSLFNLHHQAEIFRMAQKLQEHLKATELDFDKESFQVVHISPYKAEADMVQLKFDELDDKRFASHVIDKVQGINVSGIVILNLTVGQKLTEFVGFPPRLLVGLTRHKWGLVIIKSEACTELSTYTEVSSRATMLKHKSAGMIYRLQCVLSRNSVTIEAPRIEECKNCGEIGHTQSGCSQPRQKQCFNCYMSGHDSKHCKAPKKAPKIDTSSKDGEGNNKDGQNCSVCESSKHYSWEVVNCTDCGTCQDHDWQDCPKHECKVCLQHGHREKGCTNRPPCPVCKRSHKKKDCTVKHSLFNKSNFPTEDDSHLHAMEHTTGSQSATVGHQYQEPENEDTGSNAEEEPAFEPKFVTVQDLDQIHPRKTPDELRAIFVKYVASYIASGQEITETEQAEYLEKTACNVIDDWNKQWATMSQNASPLEEGCQLNYSIFDLLLIESIEGIDGDGKEVSYSVFTVPALQDDEVPNLEFMDSSNVVVKVSTDEYVLGWSWFGGIRNRSLRVSFVKSPTSPLSGEIDAAYWANEWNGAIIETPVAADEEVTDQDETNLSGDGAGDGTTENGTGWGNGDAGAGTTDNGIDWGNSGAGAGDAGAGTTDNGTGWGNGDAGAGTTDNGIDWGNSGAGAGDAGAGTTDNGTGWGNGDAGAGTTDNGIDWGNSGAGAGDAGAGTTDNGTGWGNGDAGAGTTDNGIDWGNSGAGAGVAGAGTTDNGTGWGNGDAGAGTTDNGIDWGNSGAGAGVAGAGTTDNGTGWGNGDAGAAQTPGW